MTCGLQVAGTPLPTLPERNNKPWIVGGTVLLLLLAVLGFGLYQSGILGARGQEVQAGVLKREGTPPEPGLLQSKAEPKADLTRVQAPPPEAQVNMPDDVRRWLEHLERVERKRNQLANAHIGRFMAMMVELQGAGIQEALEQMMTDMAGAASGEEAEMTPPAAGVAEDFEKARREWRDLATEFNSLPPPPDCVAARNEYDIALRETSAAVYDLIDILEQAAQGGEAKDLVAKLQQMKGTSTHIDQAGKATDRHVQDICDKYKTRKWFDIAGDIGGGGMLGRFGGGL